MRLLTLTWIMKNVSFPKKTAVLLCNEEQMSKSISQTWKNKPNQTRKRAPADFAGAGLASLTDGDTTRGVTWLYSGAPERDSPQIRGSTTALASGSTPSLHRWGTSSFFKRLNRKTELKFHVRFYERPELWPTVYLVSGLSADKDLAEMYIICH